MSEELETKIARVQALLSEQGLDALLIQEVTNFAWMTCGASSYVNTADNVGVASLLITPRERFLITDNIEAPRLCQEEMLENQGWVFKISPWYSTPNLAAHLAQGKRLGADRAYPGAMDLSTALIDLRMKLLPEEQVRFREVCHGCAQAMEAAIANILPGMTEFEIAATLGKETRNRGILPIVNLIATDERIFAFRHPLPTSKKLNRYAMLVLCGRKYGLVASITRLVHFGKISDDLRHKEKAVAEIDAALIAATRPGHSLGEIFQTAQKKYAQVGFPEEWKFHHQGGPAGYRPREAIAIPESDLMVEEGQAYAWNPSISGVKSEDSILVNSDRTDILTEIPGWPNIAIEVEGQSILRPTILEII